MTQKAKLLRSLMPISIQYLFDDVNYENIKPKDIELMKEKLNSNPIFNQDKDYSDKLINALSLGDLDYMKKISLDEHEYLQKFAKRQEKQDGVIPLILNNILQELPEKISTQNKIQLLLQLKNNNIDGALFKNKLLPSYMDLIDYAKNNKEVLVEPVQAELTEQDIDEYFANNVVSIIPSLAILDIDSMKLRLTQRLKKFDRTIKSAQKILLYPEITSALTNINKKQNKSNNYSPIKLIELTSGLIEIGVEEEKIVNYLNQTYTKAGINIDFLSQKYLEELSKSNKIKLFEQKYDFDNIYTIPSFLNQGSEWHIKQLFELLSLSDDAEYMSFIHDKYSLCGVANNSTKQLFSQNGLDYDRWLKFDEEAKFDFFNLRLNNIAEKTVYKTQISPHEKLSLRLWKRNPKFDLFQGTTASQCIALDGINCNAGVDELLYTYAQLIELYNSTQDKAMGNACLYWIKDLNGNTGLLIDSVSFKKDYSHDKNIRNRLFEFAKQYAQYVSEKANIRLFIGDNFNKFDISDLPLCSNEQYQILGDTNKNDVYLDAIIANDVSSRYISIDKDKIFDMRLREIR